ncbi:hypothetical protein PENSPDRAFT_688930 [Peniophora sp. CONT]|nr:hypothetical protein PENSPDRAFT_688930 [Peniophora sp. CONT]
MASAAATSSKATGRSLSFAARSSAAMPRPQADRSQFTRGGPTSRRHIALHGLPRTSTPDDVRRLLQQHSIGNVTNVQLEYYNFYPKGTAILTLSGAQHYNDTMDQLQRQHRFYGHTLTAAPTSAPNLGQRPPEDSRRPREILKAFTPKSTVVVEGEDAARSTEPNPVLKMMNDLLKESGEQAVSETTTNSTSTTVSTSNAASATPQIRVDALNPTNGDAQQQDDVSALSRFSLDTVPPNAELVEVGARPAVAKEGAQVIEGKESSPPTLWERTDKDLIWAGNGVQAGISDVGRSVCILGLPTGTPLSTMRLILETRGFSLRNESSRQKLSTGVWKVASPAHALSDRFLVKLSEIDAHRLVRDLHMTYHHKHLLQARIIL